MAQPVANFSATPLSGCAPLSVSFTDLSSGGPVSWQWDLGNGAQSTQQNPTTTYLNPGVYTVTLTATNAGGSNTNTKTAYITVFAAPAVSFSASQTSGCFPLRTQFTDASSPGSGVLASWEWDFGDGRISNQQNPPHDYLAAGNFSVSLKVTNDKGCSKIISNPNYIQVSPGVKADFLNSNPTVCGVPATINFSNISTGPGVVTYQWLFGDGNSSVATSPTHTYNTPGVYNVTLIASSSQGCIDTLIRSNLLSIGTNITGFTKPDTVCVNAPVGFVNTTTPNALSQVWDFGDGTSSVQRTPVKRYTVPGTYFIKLKNTFQFCTDSLTLPVVVLSNPVAAFSALDTTSCRPPFTVNFTNNSSGGAVSWLWQFGDGNTSAQQNPAHTYNANGSFNVTLIAYNAFGCADTITKRNHVRVVAPVMGITGLPLRGCVPFTINPLPNVQAADGIASYFWEFGDGTTSTLATPTKTYGVQGTYDVKLTITTNKGCTDSVRIVNAVRVGTRPTADFSFVPKVACANVAVQFTDLSAPADEWLWNFGDGGFSGIQNPAHQYGDTGKFTITLVAYNNGCPDTLRKTDSITILPPVARFDYVINCNNKREVSFTNQSIQPITWEWSFGDGNTSAVFSPTYTYAGYGNYNVKLKVTNGGCSDSLTRQVRLVNEAPDFILSRNVICRGQAITFSATNFTAGNIVDFTWDLGNGVVISTGSGSAIAVPYFTAGDFTVTLTATDVNGCRFVVVKPNVVRVNGADADFTLPNNIGCPRSITSFTDLSTTDGQHPIVNWTWDFGDGTVQSFTAPPFAHIYTTADTFDVKLVVTDSYGCKDSVRYANMVIVRDLKADFTASDTISCPRGGRINFTNKSLGTRLNYLWKFGDGNTTTVQDPTHIYAAPGVYTVTLVVTDSIGCTDSIVKTNHITILQPRADFVMSDSVTLCLPFQVNFFNTSFGWRFLNWDFGGVTSFLENPSRTYAAPGTYDVKLYAIGYGGCLDSITKRIVVYDTTGMRVTYNPLNGCSPQNVNFSINAPGPVRYTWDFDDGQTLDTIASSITHTYADYGSFQPKVIVRDPSGCNIPVIGPTNILITGARANFGVDRKLFCDSGTVNFIDSTTFNAPVTNYSWNFGDGFTSALQQPSHLYATPGLYTVTLTVTTQGGCTSVKTIPDLVKVVASPRAAITGDTAGCPGARLQLAASLLVPDTSAITWLWNINGQNFSGTTPPIQQFVTPGNYPATLIAVNSTGCADTVSQNLTVYPIPTSTVTTPIVIPAGSSILIPITYSAGVNIFNWAPSNTLDCNTCPNPVATPKGSTTYRVNYTDNNGCRNSDTVRIEVLCSDKNIYIPNTFSPNGDGVNDIFFPRGKGVDRVRSMVIFNRWGNIVYERIGFIPNDPSSGWNGRYKNVTANPDVYTYIIEVICDNNQIIKYRGNISLIR